MEPQPVDHPAFTVIGLQARTTNAAERDPSTARIGALWGAYLSGGGASQVPGGSAASITFSVYSGYESDYRGAYDVLVGTGANAAVSPPPGWRRIVVPAGRFLVFTASGPMPATVIQTWAAIWKYFDEHSDVRRAYTADFELHDPAHPDRVAIYIAVRGA
jgi:predicted transcriptional regulator YdeE